MSSEQWLKTIDFINGAYEAGSSSNLAAGLGKLAAMAAAGGLTEAYLRTAMPMIRLGYAISGRSDQWAKWKAFSGWAAGEVTGIIIDQINDLSLGGYIYDWTHVDPLTNTDFLAARNIVVSRDPLVLDLDGDGLELAGASGAVLFDHNADGIKTGTGWAMPDDGLLVRDVNGNGVIDTGRELFGVDTIKSNNTLATDGFDALRDLDSNGDGFITGADTAYAELKVWQDSNQDGISQSTELKTLTELNISSIGVNGTTTGPQAGQVINNNGVALSTTFTQNGQTHTVGAIDLEANNFFTEFPPEVVDEAGNPVTISAQAQALPQMNGSGMVRNMRAAASLNGDLGGVFKNLRFTCRRVVSKIRKAVSLTGVLLVGNLYAAQNSNVLYMVTLSPDSSRVAIAKWQESTKWELFESTLQQSFRKLRLPTGQQADSSILYSADGKRLLFTTVPERPATKSQADKSEHTSVGPTTLWQQHMDSAVESAPQKIFERALPISNVLTLTDGSLVFLGKVDEVKSHSSSPIKGSNRVWSTYKWILRKPDGTANIINPRGYSFFSSASLIRDEAVFLVQQRLPLNLKEYYLDITAIKSGVDLSSLELWGNIQDRRAEPRLQCDWAGKTCARLITFEKDGYHAHQLELIRGGKVCKVEGLPDRIEQMAISRSGNALALITRPTPRKNIDYKLAYMTVKADGCADERKFLELP